MKKQIGLVLAGAGLLAGVLAATAVTARPSRAGGDDVEVAGHEFSDRSIKGWWAFSTDLGYLMPPAAPEPTPTVAVGRLYFDGEGGCSVENVINVAGNAVEARSESCSYSVRANGTGTAEAVLVGAPITDPIPVAFVISDRGRELRFVNTKFVVGSFTARRQ